MIELTSRNGDPISINSNFITAIKIEDIVTVVDVGDRTYHVRESYAEVLQKIKGNDLETK